MQIAQTSHAPDYKRTCSYCFNANAQCTVKASSDKVQLIDLFPHVLRG